jgi:hypothetical protein
MIIVMTAAAILPVPTVQQDCPGALAGTWNQVSVDGLPYSPGSSIMIEGGKVVEVKNEGGGYSESVETSTCRTDHDRIVITLQGKRTVSSKGDMHPPGIPWDTMTTDLGRRSISYRIARQCPQRRPRKGIVLRDMKNPDRCAIGMKVRSE